MDGPRAPIEGWRGRSIRLVPVEKSRHLENCVRWVNDPEVTRWMAQGDFPLSRAGEEAVFDDWSRNAGQSVIPFAIETLEGRHIGMTGLHAIDWRNRVAVSGTFIGEQELWGKGLGTDVARTRTRYAFDVLGLRLVLSEVMRGNDASLKALVRAGYREAGVIPGRWWKRGAWRDKILLYVDRDGFAAASA